MKPTSPAPAIYSTSETTYHADTCKPVRDAIKRGELRQVAFCRLSYPGHPLPPKMLPGVSSIGYWDAPRPQSWGLDWHRNEGIELTYISQGKTGFAVRDRSYLLESGHLTITRPWQEHLVGNPNVGACRLHCLILDVGVRRPDQPWRWPDWLILAPTDLQRLTTLLSHNEQPVWQANAALGNCFARIAELVETKKPLVVQTRLQLCINELFVVLLELLETKKVVLNARLTSTRRSVELFLNSLLEHVEHPWTLDEMAHQCGLGRTRFADYCRQITNLTPAEYLIHCRVETARKLLATRLELNISEIGFACGFQTSQYFTTVFHRKTGLSPRQFRQGAK